MRKRLLAFAGIVVVSGLASVPTAFAHQGHGSCAAGAANFTPPPYPGASADIVVPIARSGEFGEFEGVLHEAFCEPM